MKTIFQFKPASARRIFLTGLAILLSLGMVTAALAATVTTGVDVKVTNDNNNVDGGTPNPSFDTQNRQGNEATLAISPADIDIIA